MVLETPRLGDRTPALVGVYWRGGGGHAIVAAGVNSSGRVIYLDPWDGKVNEQANNGVFNARYGGIGDVGVALYLS